jgi:hypothetical protein
MTIVCTHCKKIKADDGFKMCEKCRKRSRAQYYRTRREREKSRGEWMAALKATMSCADCGISYPDEPHRMHWDHLPGTIKVANVSDLVYKGKVEEALEEVEKCELVCARCHTRRGRERGQVFSQPSLAPTLQCDHCAEPFRRHQSRVRRRNYCSRQCSGLARRSLKVRHWKRARPAKPPKQYSERTVRRAELLDIPLPNGEAASSRDAAHDLPMNDDR